MPPNDEGWTSAGPKRKIDYGVANYAQRGRTTTSTVYSKAIKSRAGASIRQSRTVHSGEYYDGPLYHDNAGSRAGYGQTNYSTQSYRPDRTRHYDRRYNRDDFFVGAVFSAPYHTEDFNQAPAHPTDEYRTQSTMGVVYSKYRKFVVISCLDRHIVALPIFTHNGTGLEGKPLDEYISIRDSDDPDPAKSETHHGRLYHKVHQSFEQSKYARMKNNTSVQFTFPVCYKYGVKMAITGKLENASKMKLAQLYKDLMLGKIGDSPQSPTTPKVERTPVVKAATGVTDILAKITHQEGSRASSTQATPTQAAPAGPKGAWNKVGATTPAASPPPPSAWGPPTAKIKAPLPPVPNAWSTVGKSTSPKRA